jgi:hypothetical protein
MIHKNSDIKDKNFYFGAKIFIDEKYLTMKIIILNKAKDKCSLSQ